MIASSRMRRAAVGVLVAAGIAPGAHAGGTPFPPAVEFMGSRFYPARSGIETLLGIGFDPINDHVASQSVTDLCGQLVSDWTFEAGIAWDPVDEEFWLINTQSREVYRFDENNQPDVIFTIPQSFDVPGVGQQTIYSPQGLAMDMSHVYVVDAGENIGELAGNQWFKFTRDGTPVSSSAATDFVTSIDAPVDDAVVDGIVWSPPSCPFAPGLFLVAVEHSGIMVIDADGFFVDDITWDEAGLDFGFSVPSGLGDITIDPSTGDLYLVENGGTAHVWVRVQDERSIVYGHPGGADSRLRVHLPDTRCERELLQPATGAGLVFGLTYRTADGLLWGIDYNSGSVHTFDPRRGSVVQSALAEGAPINCSGAAYDPERDTLYFHHTGGGEIHVLDPETFVFTTLPGDPGGDFGGWHNDLAFDTDDSNLYRVDLLDGEATLFRIDRDTGTGTPVGPTGVNIFGLTYDPANHWLVGSPMNGGELVAVDPTTAVVTPLATSASSSSMYGLALVPPPAPTVGTGDVAVTPVALTPLTAAPNPTARGTSIGFRLVETGAVSIDVHDASGRRVAQEPLGLLGRGSHTYRWDARGREGHRVAPGVYFLRVRAGRTSQSTKITVVE